MMILLWWARNLIKGIQGMDRKHLSTTCSSSPNTAPTHTLFSKDNKVHYISNSEHVLLGPRQAPSVHQWSFAKGGGTPKFWNQSSYQTDLLKSGPGLGHSTDSEEAKVSRLCHWTAMWPRVSHSTTLSLPSRTVANPRCKPPAAVILCITNNLLISF